MDLLSAVRATGFSLAKFTRETDGIGYDTLMRAQHSPSTVKPETMAKIRRGILSLKNERERLLSQIKLTA